MKHLRKFESYTFKRKVIDIIKEDVMMMGDIYKVRTTTDVTQSMINSVIKKAKENGTDLRKMYSDIQIAEIIADFNKGQLNVENVPVQAFTGGEMPNPAQNQQAQPMGGVQQLPAQAQMQPQAQPMAGAQVQPGAQVQQPAQVQPGAQVQQPGMAIGAQAQPAQGVSPAAQDQAQVQQPQVQPQAQDGQDFEEVNPDEEDEDDENEENMENDPEDLDLPV